MQAKINVLNALQQGTLRYSDIVKLTSYPDKTIFVTLSKLKEEHKVKQNEEGTWEITKAGIDELEKHLFLAQMEQRLEEPDYNEYVKLNVKAYNALLEDSATKIVQTLNLAILEAEQLFKTKGLLQKIIVKSASAPFIDDLKRMKEIWQKILPQYKPKKYDHMDSVSIGSVIHSLNKTVKALRELDQTDRGAFRALAQRHISELEGYIKALNR